MRETAIQICCGLSVVAFFLYVALFMLLWVGALKETRVLKVIIGFLFAVNGLGIVLAGIFSGHPFGYDTLTRFMAIACWSLVISGGFFIFSALSETGKNN